MQQPVAEALGQRRAARQHNVCIQRLAQVEVCPCDGVDHHLVKAGVLEADDLGVEQNFWCPEALGANLSGQDTAYGSRHMRCSEEKGEKRLP